MYFKRRLLKFITRGKYKAFINDTLHPERAASQLWQDEIEPLLRKGTYWSQKVDLNDYKQLEDFDITTYEDYHVSLEQAMSSNLQPINGEAILFWSETSATTGKRKYFPITQSFQKQFQRTMAPYFYSLLDRYPDFLKKKIVYLAAWDTGVYSSAKINMGLISHYNYKHLPALIKSFYALPIEIFTNEETFIKWAPLYALAYDLSAIFAVVPIVIDGFFKQCSENFKEYLPYLLGQKAMPTDLPKLNISKNRHAYLRCLDKNATPNYVDLWPGLILAGCWIEGPCKPYATQLADDLGKKIDLIDGTYSATEGWLTVPINKEHRGAVLHPRTHIAEFIEEDKDLVKGNLLQSWQLEPGKRYEIFLTTAMGFVRYRLKDIVECTGYFNRAPILVFCYKVSRILLDYCALTESDLRTAVKISGIKIKPYWHFACDKRRDRLYLVIDSNANIPSHAIEEIHNALIKTNEKYAYESKNGGVLPCKLARVDKSLLVKYHHAQTKPKIISQDILDIQTG